MLRIPGVQAGFRTCLFRIRAVPGLKECGAQAHPDSQEGYGIIKASCSFYRRPFRSNESVKLLDDYYSIDPGSDEGESQSCLNQLQCAG